MEHEASGDGIEAMDNSPVSDTNVVHWFDACSSFIPLWSSKCRDRFWCEDRQQCPADLARARCLPGIIWSGAIEMKDGPGGNEHHEKTGRDDAERAAHLRLPCPAVQLAAVGYIGHRIVEPTSYRSNIRFDFRFDKVVEVLQRGLYKADQNRRLLTCFRYATRMSQLLRSAIELECAMAVRS